MNTALALNVSPVGNVTDYLRAIEAAPLLSPDQERELALRFRDQRDPQAAWRLVVSHLRFVVKFARQYAGYGLPEEDLIQQGNVGLMKAVKRFDPDAGVRLLSYAVHWIRAEIHDFILKNWRIVKVASTGAQRKLFFKLRSSKERLEWLRSDETQQLAHKLGVGPDDVRRMEQRLYSRDKAFDARSNDDDDGFAPAPADYLSSDQNPESLIAESQWQGRCKEKLRPALRTLDSRSRDILTRRWLIEDKACLKELAADHGVSAERIRQIEQQALNKLRRRLTTDITLAT